MVNDEEVFENMTDVFVRVRYGGVQPTQQEDKLLTDFYDKFLQCYRQNAGTVKYILNYFKL